MVTRYDVISSRWSSHFWVKVHVFQLFSTLKVKLVDRMMQSKYLCVILQVKRKKIFILPFFFTWFLILDKTQAGGQDGKLVLRCHRNPAVPPPTKYTSSCREDQRLSTEGKILLKHCNISKTIKEGGPSTHPPCTTVEVCVYVWGLSSGPMDVVKLTMIKQNSMVFCKC